MNYQQGGRWWLEWDSFKLTSYNTITARNVMLANLHQFRPGTTDTKKDITSKLWDDPKTRE